MLNILQHLQQLLATPSSSVAAIGTLTLAAVLSFGLIKDIIRRRSSPLRSLKGPKGGHAIFGHLKQVRDARTPGIWQQEQLEKYGSVCFYKGWLNEDTLLTNDSKALHHILANSMTYQKPEELQYTLGLIVGKGLLCVEGHDHKRQRRIMSPAFATVHLKNMTEIFVTKSLELREALASLTTREQVDGWTPANMLSYLSCATLDIIGFAGFNCSFDSIQHLSEGSRAQDDLPNAFAQVLHSANAMSPLSLLKRLFPFFRFINWDSRSKALRNAEKTVQRIGKQLVNEKRNMLQSSQDEEKAKDLLTLLIKANMSEGGNTERGMTDEEVMNQIPTFLVAGHETTSTATTWALYSLATHPDIQDKLRQELLESSMENPSMEDLNALPYLECVVRETLRYHSIVSGTNRVATQDDVIPLDKPFEDKYGSTHHSIRVAKGDNVFVPVRAMNMNKDIWGPDAEEFNPNRWIDPPKASSSIPGTWGNQLSFLGGPRGCIGFRFALVEMKALLFELVRSFEFKLAVPADDVVGQMGFVTRPSVLSQPTKGKQLPMLIRKIK